MTFQQRPTFPPSPGASPGDTWTRSLLADFLTFNPSQITCIHSFHSFTRQKIPPWISQQLQIPCIHNPSTSSHPHFQSIILYFKQFAEDLRIIFTSFGHARKYWDQPASSFPWFTSKTKISNLGLTLILNSWIATLLTFHFSGAIFPKFHTHLEAVAQRCFVKNVFLEISQNLQENASLCTGVFLWILRKF